jgi:hypothetical protein
LNGLFAFEFFPSHFDPKQGGDCDSLLYCFVTSLNFGLRHDGGLADIMAPVTYPNQSQTTSLLHEIHQLTVNVTNASNMTSSDNPDLVELPILLNALVRSNISLLELKNFLSYLNATNGSRIEQPSFLTRLGFDLSFYTIFNLTLISIVFGKQCYTPSQMIAHS